MKMQMFVVVLLVRAVVTKGVVGFAAFGTYLVQHAIVAETLQDAVDGYAI
jgi:hypothetical protein